MGIAQQEIEAEEVIIRCRGENIIIRDPQVSKVNMMGQETFQIVGTITTEQVSADVEISDEDITTVSGQTGVDRKTAEKAIADADGDLAEAILSLKDHGEE